MDQGIEHSAAASFAPNPIYFDPENIAWARSSVMYALPLRIDSVFDPALWETADSRDPQRIAAYLDGRQIGRASCRERV